MPSELIAKKVARFGTARFGASRFGFSPKTNMQDTKEADGVGEGNYYVHRDADPTTDFGADEGHEEIDA